MNCTRLVPFVVACLPLVPSGGADAARLGRDAATLDASQAPRVTLERVFGLAEESPVHAIEAHAAQVTALTVTADGRHGLVATADGLVQLWCLDGLPSTAPRPGDLASAAEQEPFFDLALRDDLRAAYATDGFGQLHSWSLADAAGCSTAASEPIQIDPPSDERAVVTGPLFSSLILLEDGRLIRAVDQDLRLLEPVGDDPTRLREADSVHLSRRIEGVALAPDGTMVVGLVDHCLTGAKLDLSADHPLAGAMDAEGRDLGGRVFQCEETPSLLTLSADGRWLVGVRKTELSVWNPGDDWALVGRLPLGPSGVATDVVISAAGDWVFVAHESGVIQRVRLPEPGAKSSSEDTLLKAGQVRGGGFLVSGSRSRPHLALVPEMQTLISARDTGAFETWRTDLDDDTFFHHRAALSVGGLTFSPDGGTLVGWTDDRLMVWRIRGVPEPGPDFLMPLQCGAPITGGVSLTADGGHVAVGTRRENGDATVEIWSLDGGAPAKAALVVSLPDWLRSVSISGDGRWLVTSTGDDRVRLWSVDADAGRSELVDTWTGKTLSSAMALSPAETHLAVGAHGGRSHLIELDLGSSTENFGKAIPLDAPGNEIGHLAWLDGGRRLVTGSHVDSSARKQEASIVVWTLSPDASKPQAEAAIVAPWADRNWIATARLGTALVEEEILWLDMPHSPTIGEFVGEECTPFVVPSPDGTWFVLPAGNTIPTPQFFRVRRQGPSEGPHSRDRGPGEVGTPGKG